MTVRTGDGNPGENVRAAMERDRRIRQNQPRAATVLSEDATTQGASEVGGPNPNTEGEPVREASVPEAPENDQAPSEEAQATPENPQDTQTEEKATEAVSEALARPSEHFGGLDKWRAYRLANGYSEDEIEGLGRDQLKDLDDR